MAARAEVFRQGDAGDSLYLVADGALAAYVTAGDERGAVRVGLALSVPYWRALGLI